jgi:hypothetical protein
MEEVIETCQPLQGLAKEIRQLYEEHRKAIEQHKSNRPAQWVDLVRKDGDTELGLTH